MIVHMLHSRGIILASPNFRSNMSTQQRVHGRTVYTSQPLHTCIQPQLADYDTISCFIMYEGRSSQLKLEFKLCTVFFPPFLGSAWFEVICIVTSLIDKPEEQDCRINIKQKVKYRWALVSFHPNAVLRLFLFLRDD